MNKILPKIIVLAGSTGVGKTKISIDIAKAIGGEIICADSVQVYKDCTIGSNKVTAEERNNVPHHLMDIAELKESYNVKKYFHDASIAIRQVLSRGNVPIIVGGCGFYIQSLLRGIPQEAPIDDNDRIQIPKFEEYLKTKGWDYTIEKLYKEDPESAKLIQRNDFRRAAKSLYIVSNKGFKFSSLLEKDKISIADKYDFRAFYITAPKTYLFDALNYRCEEMITKGLIKEVAELLGKGLTKNDYPSQSIGYRETIEILTRPLSQKLTIADVKAYLSEFQSSNRNYSRRQSTWFKRLPEVQWVNGNPLPYTGIISKASWFTNPDVSKLNITLPYWETIETTNDIMNRFNKTRDRFEKDRDLELEKLLKMTDEHSSRYVHTNMIFKGENELSKLLFLIENARSHLSKIKPELFLNTTSNNRNKLDFEDG
ncbi:putative isopentenyltransferase [Tieghemostelium lacteum]|uniref:tRNA dimethylallyltransferase n=1 Tax=Tieghemostelium lacteum TaxID=361077 RepID=A0A152A494_TIELA|nr:putative isopentenyltransferase [Tieghemostelium lacteum]|eukprot:KYR00887.1 putative isopentenyltransferase [Tieghemostelium lacteum]